MTRISNAMHPTLIIRLLCATWLLVGPLAQAQAQARAQAQADCPPQALQPTPEQVQLAQTTARDRGLLWRISRDGRSSYLFGSIHVGRFDWLFPGPRLREALADTDTLALEVDLADDQVRQDVVQAMAQAGRRSPALPLALRQRMDRLVAAACLPPQALAAQHPVMQALTLTVLSARRQGFDPAYAQEMALSGAARAANIPVLSLESAALQLQALIPTEPARAVRLVTQSVQQLESGRGAQTLARLGQAWADGNLDDLAAYETWCDCVRDEEDRAALRRLNDARNPHLAERIEALHAQGKRLFAAVGALHMTGAQALPALLAAKGFVVERIELGSAPR